MDLIAENHSMYPRVGESEEELRLRHAHHDVDQGDIDESEFKSIEDSYVDDIINEQEERGLDRVTDGMIRWYDHISHLAEGIAGAQRSGLVRYFDTNYLVREAEITGHLEWESPIIVDEVEFADSVANQPAKAILTGPLTMARHSITEESPYDSERDLASDYAAVLKQEVKAISEAGIEHLQLEEPSLLQTPEDAGWVLDLVDDILADTEGLTTRFATYFGDVVPVYDQLQELDVDVLIHDFTYSDNLADVITERGAGPRLGFGLLNGRNTKLMDPDRAVGTIQKVTSEIEADASIVTFSCSLDYLPRDRARRKLDHLSTIKQTVQSGSKGAVQT